MTIKDQILQNTFPESMFTERDPATGLVNIDRIEKNAESKINSYTDAVTIPETPLVSASSILRALIPNIPTIEIPNPAEIREFVNARIRIEKQRAQEQSIAKLTADAVKENKPFTARKDMTNAELRKNSRG